MLKLKLQYLGNLIWRADSLEKIWCWERLKAGGEEDNRGWDGWMASPTQWTWIWVKSGRGWRTRRPGVLHSMGSERAGHDWATEQQQQRWIVTSSWRTDSFIIILIYCPSLSPIIFLFWSLNALSEVNVAPPAFFWLVLEWWVFPCPHAFLFRIRLCIWLCQVLVVARSSIFVMALGVFGWGVWTISCDMWDLAPLPGYGTGPPALGAES